MQFHTSEKLGPKQSLTPEGYLLCLEVPLARTGMMIYGPDETPVSAGPDGIVKIFRDSEEVFSEITLASANGKSVVNEHPEDDVVPENWVELTKGICLNPRRGTGIMDDLMIGDLLITVPEEIKAVQEGKREISLGYDADYTEVEPGVGKQTNIIINHIALVENGRCGPRCAIGDTKPNLKKETEMAKKQVKDKARATWLDKLMKAFDSSEKPEEVQDALAEVVDEMTTTMDDDETGGDTHVHIHTGTGDPATTVNDEENDPETDKTKDDDLEARFAAIESRLSALESVGSSDTVDEATEAQLEEEAPAGTKDKARKAKDSVYLEDSFQETFSLAEIIAPGIRAPVFDKAARPAETLKTICNLRNTALDLAYGIPATRGIIEDILGQGKTLDTKNMTCDAVRNLFKAVASVKKTANKSVTNDMSQFSPSQNEKKGPMSIADINKLNTEYYKKQFPQTK